MTVGTIQETVDAVLQPYRGRIPHEYNSVIVRLISTLERRDATIAADIRQIAERYDINPTYVDSTLREVGLDVRPTPPAPAVAADSAERARRMAAELDEMLPKMTEMRKRLSEEFGI